jgi:hypothetical protein
MPALSPLSSKLAWPSAGEIDVMESMGNAAPHLDFALDHASTSAALHMGTEGSWYYLAHTPTHGALTLLTRLTMLHPESPWF